MSILIISHTKKIGKKLKKYLKKGGFKKTLCARSANDAFNILGLGSEKETLLGVDLILVDMALPDPGGLSVCRIIQEEGRFRDLPFIVISGNEGVKNLTAAFSFGAVDYIYTPPRKVETLTRVRAALRLKQEMDIRKAREHELLEVTKNLAAANQTLRRMAFLDGLTGIANRRYFDEFLQKEWRRAVRTKKAIALILLDIDHFKEYNDIYGHFDGDECLKLVAKTLESTMKRPGDHAIRYGGEEFAVILAEDINAEGAMVVAESLRANVAALVIEHNGSTTSDHVTISVGVALCYPGGNISQESLVAAADRALYDAKLRGRNQVQIATKPAR